MCRYCLSPSEKLVTFILILYFVCVGVPSCVVVAAACMAQVQATGTETETTKDQREEEVAEIGTETEIEGTEERTGAATEGEKGDDLDREIDGREKFVEKETKSGG